MIGSSAHKKILARFERLKEDILMAGEVDRFETPAQKRERVERLKANYSDFCRYYFPNYCSAPLASFHQTLFKAAAANPNRIYLLQWSREFAKSVHSNILFPLYLKANGQLSGMIIGCANADEAVAKLSDIQAILEVNPRILNDYGDQISFGNWEDGNFACKDGTFFRAFGRKQSPRGVRFRQNRPNYGTVDDIDDKKLVKNDQLAAENYAWVKEDFMAALSINKWWLMVPENKFHKNTVTAKFEADSELKSRIHLSRVNLVNSQGQSNWPEYISDEAAKAKMESIGTISAQREYMNNPIEEGTIFKEEDMQWGKILPLNRYDHLITYTDPSYKNTDKSDYKATVLVGKKGLEYHIIKAFVDKVSLKTMFCWLYDMDSLAKGLKMEAGISHYMEANFLQDLLWGELHTLAKDKGYMLPVVQDRRGKPDKFQRVEALQPLFQRGLVLFNEKEKDNQGMQRLRSQFLAFEKGSRANDDGPDACEGAIHILNEKSFQAQPPVIGRRRKSNNHY